ncbi:uncharacterized protein LOC117223961 [Megalopta genalis]|uniref:uncharacterized protein LOC117223961 n=1 Tax=Megalopta genalis TaxID=115081 RepID=UPI0014438520|nr:uncharacterized protein LOC117223961 [Megalopta genalis]XP_033332463.1 uncharacterized protein LOC117223961 [Megalopta genalis]
MSDAETIKPDASQGSHEPKSNQPDNAENAVPCAVENASAAENATASAMQEQVIPPLAKEPEVAGDSKGQDVPEKEAKPSEISNDGPSTNGAAIENEIAVVSEEKIAGEAAKIVEFNQSEQLSKVAEFEKQAVTGAGDTCPVANLKKEDDQAPIKEIGKQLATPENKSLAEGDLKVNNDGLAILKLKEEVKKISVERDCCQKKLENTEKKLVELQSSYDALLKGEGDDVLLRRMIDQLKAKLVQTSLQLEDRIRIVSNQEKQISALNSQVVSLKEVESLTRSLLEIRNLEVNQLQAEVNDMEARITEERERYSTMINKMEAAVKLNADLKKEYETQLCLFRDLREKYEEKVSLLSEEKRALENSVQPVSE